MTLSLTIGELKVIAEIDHVQCGDAAAMVRFALAAYEQKPVILYRERNPYNGMATGWQELTQQEFDFVKDNASENAEFKTLYAHPAPSIPAVPTEWKLSDAIAFTDKYQPPSEEEAALFAWNACRDGGVL